MHPWAQILLVTCVVAVTVALVPTIVALGRAARHAASVLLIVEQELRPLISQTHALADEVRALTREAKDEVERVGEVTERVNTVAEGLGRVVSALGGLTRAGQIVGLASGLRKGVDVFVQRFRKEQGDHHE